MDKDNLTVIGAIALNDIFGQEPHLAREIIRNLGSPQALFSLPQKELSRLFGPYSKYSGKIGRSCIDCAAARYESLIAEGYSFLYAEDEAYPDLLRECPDAPVILYVRSSTPAQLLFNRRPAVSIVGTRDISLYGKEWCTRIVAALSTAEKPPLIVSGLAIGVDITAHLAALGHSLPTIAVSPVGIDDIYPHRHEAVARRMADTPGCAIITDYPPGTVPMPHVFLRRNRIIAGISGSTILVESKEKGGGMMTARLASGYGRSVYVLPGRIDDPRSAGCNRLLAEKIAEPVVNPGELAAALGLGSTSRKREKAAEAIEKAFGGSLAQDELQKITDIYNLVRRHRGISYDELCSMTGMPYPQVAKLAGMLESADLICSDMLQRCTTNSNFA